MTQRFELEIRTRYGETDQAGVVYHSNYLNYFEIARTEWLRAAGATYKAVEDSGVLLTVVEAHAKYLKPALYDDLLRVHVWLGDVSGVRVRFEYEIHRGDDLLCSGYTVLASIRRETGRPCRLPEELKARLDAAS